MQFLPNHTAFCRRAGRQRGASVGQRCRQRTGGSKLCRSLPVVLAGWRRVLPHSRPAAIRAATTCIASRSNSTATFEIGQRHYRRYRRQYIPLHVPEHPPPQPSPAATETNNPQRWYGCCDARGREHPSAGKLVGAITRARLTDVNSRRKTPRASRPCSMYGPLFRIRYPDDHPRETGWRWLLMD
jgi:hypothetical protein